MLRIILFLVFSLGVQASHSVLGDPMESFEFRVSKLQETLAIWKKKDSGSYVEFMKILGGFKGKPPAPSSLGDRLKRVMHDQGIAHRRDDIEKLIQFFLTKGISTGVGSFDPLSTYKHAKLFKIGFEFQDANHVCPWAINCHEIKDKDIFCVRNKEGRLLWKLTIDWQDLEFVTEPFSSNQEEDLLLAMETIEIACDVLQKLARNSSNGQVSFTTWVQGFNKMRPANVAPIKIPNDIARYLSKIIFKVPVGKTMKDVEIKFLPQVTIQHHLSDTLNLTMGLFASDLVDAGGAYKVNTIKSKLASFGSAEVIKNCFPLGDRLRDAVCVPVSASAPDSSSDFFYKYKTTKQSGFLFLHMMTCAGLAKHAKADLNKAIDLIYDTVFNGTGQVNPKASIRLLSRRPFSSMWRDIRSVGEFQSYEKLVKARAEPGFLDKFNDAFKCLNYGEIYNSFYRYPDLKVAHFDVDDKIHNLQVKGVVSTSMLLLSKNYAIKQKVQDVFAHYFEDVIKSVDDPSTVKRYTFKPAISAVLEKATDYDVLSPLHFVSDADSMGGYKSDNHDKNYGEAIVEFRDISCVSKRALVGIMAPGVVSDDIVGKFLYSPFDGGNCVLQTQVKGLFSYLRNLLGGS